MSSEPAQKPVGDPPLMICLHCKDYRNPIKKALSPACFRWAPSVDAKRAWMIHPVTEMERWAQDRIRTQFRKAAYPEG